MCVAIRRRSLATLRRLPRNQNYYHQKLGLSINSAAGPCWRHQLSSSLWPAILAFCFFTPILFKFMLRAETLLDGLAEVSRVHFHSLAHLVEPRAQRDAELVERLFHVGHGFPRGHAHLGPLRRFAEGKRGGNQSDLLLVVTRVDDVAQSFLDPVAGIRGGQLVERQDLDVEHRLEDAQLRRLRDGVVTVLDLLQQVAEIVEQALDAFGRDQLAQYGHRQVRLADSRGPDEQQAEVRGVFLDKALGPELGRLQAAVGCSLLILADVEVLQGAVLVAARDAGLREQLRGALRFAARAPGHAADAVSFDRFPSCALAFSTVIL